MPSGAFLTARNWAKMGELVRSGGVHRTESLVDESDLRRCFQGTAANPAYGTTFWLNQPVSQKLRRSIRELRFATDDMSKTAKIPRDTFYAAGAGKQRLYIIPSLKLTIVRQSDDILATFMGNRSQFSDVEFLSRLID